MQGTIVMMMALTGLGCHHKHSGHGYAAACYAEAVSYEGCYASGQGCYATTQVGYVDYAPSCYATAYSACYAPTYASCYGASWDACYSPAACYGDWGGCYGGSGHKHGGLFACLKRKRCGACNGGYNACYGSWYDAGYNMPVFGSYTPTYGGDVIYGTPVGSSQWTTPQTTTMPTNVAPTDATVPATGTDASPPPPAAAPTDSTAPGTSPTPPDAGLPSTPPAAPAGEVPAAPVPGGDLPVNAPKPGY